MKPKRSNPTHFCAGQPVTSRVTMAITGPPPAMPQWRGRRAANSATVRRTISLTVLCDRAVAMHSRSGAVGDWRLLVCLSAGFAAKHHLMRTSRRHSFNRRCNVRRCPSGKTPGCPAAAARTIRAMSATARPRTIHATAPSLSQTGRDADARAAPSLSAGWSGAPLRPATPCAGQTETAPVSAWSGRRFVTAGRSAISTSSCCAARILATTEPDPAWRRSPSPGAALPRWSAHPPAAADTASPADDISS